MKIGAKGRKFIKIKKATYNAATNSVSLQFKGKAVKINKKGYTVLIAASMGIVKSENGTNLLNNGRTVLDFRPADHDLRQVSRSLAFNDFSQCLGVATRLRGCATAEYSSPGVWPI